MPRRGNRSFGGLKVCGGEEFAERGAYLGSSGEAASQSLLKRCPTARWCGTEEALCARTSTTMRLRFLAVPLPIVQMDEIAREVNQAAGSDSLLQFLGPQLECCLALDLNYALFHFCGLLHREKSGTGSHNSCQRDALVGS